MTRTCVVNKCPWPAESAQRLCLAHSGVWIASREHDRISNGPPSRNIIEYSKSMFADFVRRMEVDGSCLGGLKNIIDVQPTQKLPPVVMAPSKYMPEGH